MLLSWFELVLLLVCWLLGFWFDGRYVISFRRFWVYVSWLGEYVVYDIFRLVVYVVGGWYFVMILLVGRYLMWTRSKL